MAEPIQEVNEGKSVTEFEEALGLSVDDLSAIGSSVVKDNAVVSQEVVLMYRDILEYTCEEPKGFQVTGVSNANGLNFTWILVTALILAAAAAAFIVIKRRKSVLLVERKARAEPDHVTPHAGLVANETVGGQRGSNSLAHRLKEAMRHASNN